MESLNINLSELVEIYNCVPNVLSRKAIKVSISEENLITKTYQHQSIFLANNKNVNYWIIGIEDDNYWLLPKGNFKIDIFNYETLKILFQSDQYQPKNVNKFTLLQPAKVSLTPTQLTWKLEDIGRLDFSNTSDVSQLQTELKVQAELELINEEYNKLQLQFTQLTQERNQLQLQLTQLTEQSQLRQQEFSKQIQQNAQQRQYLLNRIQMQLGNKLNNIRIFGNY